MGIRTEILRRFGLQPVQKALPPIRRRNYAGAIISRLTADWMASQASADAEIRTSLRKLRDRSREMVRNNPYAKQAKRTTQINVVGSGIKMQSQVTLLRGSRRDERTNNLIEQKWAAWCRPQHCDVAGRQSFHMMEWLATGALPESGEALFRIVRRSFGGSKVPLALQMLEADYLDEEYQGPTLAKAVLDALTDAGAWGDDSQVVALTVRKKWSWIPHTLITISESP